MVRGGREWGGQAAGGVQARVDAMSDEVLLDAVRLGDGDAFLILYDRYRDVAWRVARSVSTTDVDAEDAVAEGFAKILAAVGRRDIDSFRSYLAATVRHAALDIHRRRESATGDLALSPADPTQPATEELGLRSDDDRLVMRAFGHLDERQRVALWLAEVECFSTAEVGAVVGTTPNGAAALVMRARERLRQAYLSEHLRTPMEGTCADVTARLAAHVRGATARRWAQRIDDHLADCAACGARRDELRSLNRSLAAAIPAAPASLLAGRDFLDRDAVAASSDRGATSQASPSGPDVGRFLDRLPHMAQAAPQMTEFAAASLGIAERVAHPVAAAVAGVVVAAASFGVAVTAPSGEARRSPSPPVEVADAATDAASSDPGGAVTAAQAPVDGEAENAPGAEGSETADTPALDALAAPSESLSGGDPPADLDDASAVMDLVTHDAPSLLGGGGAPAPSVPAPGTDPSEPLTGPAEAEEPASEPITDPITAGSPDPGSGGGTPGATDPVKNPPTSTSPGEVLLDSAPDLDAPLSTSL